MSHSEISPVAADVIKTDEGRRWEIIKLTTGVVAIILITVASFWVALHPEWLMRFGNWGYLGAFLVSMIASATVVLPAPGIAIVVAMGVALNPLALSIAAGVGSAFGELSGYLAGAGGRALVKSRHQQWLERIHRLAEDSHAPFVFFVLAAIPFPLFDLAGIAAGMMGMRVSSFVLAVALGKTVKYLALILLLDYLI
jgi:membrane protein YqaA with SNARE-associated domain